MHEYTDTELRALIHDKKVRDLVLKTFLKAPIEIGITIAWNGKEPLEERLKDPNNTIENGVLQERLEVILNDVPEFEGEKLVLEKDKASIAKRHGFSPFDTAS